MTIQWKDAFSTGLETIDVQHRTLFRYTNELERMVAGGISQGREVDNLLGLLEGYANAHFRYEEGCSRRHKCRLHEQNIQEHGLFRDQLIEFTRRLETEQPRLRVLKELHRALEAWLQGHIMKVDVTMKERVCQPFLATGTPQKPTA